MRKLSYLFLFCFLVVASFGYSEVITDELRQAMENERNGEFRVIVEMQEQFDVASLKHEHMIRGDVNQVKEQIYQLLQEKARISQHWMRTFLSSAERSTQVKDVHHFWLVNAVSFKASAEIIRQIAEQKDIKAIHLDNERIMIDPIICEETDIRAAWGVPYIHSEKAHERGYKGQGIIVAVVDTGVDTTHTGFASGQILVDQAKSFVSGENHLTDGNGHGTHCSGTVASSAYGVAPEAKIIPVKVLSSAGSGTWTGVMQGVEYVFKETDANVISMSLGGGASTSGNVVETAVSNAISAGIVCVIAAGNSGPGTKTIGTPGVVKEAITVGAISSNGVIASFSSRGPSVYNESKPEIVAPGVSITSLWKGGSTNTISGTSMATPHVAGLVALILSKNKSLTPAQVKALIISTAFGTKEVNVYGDGCVDADATTK